MVTLHITFLCPFRYGSEVDDGRPRRVSLFGLPRLPPLPRLLRQWRRAALRFNFSVDVRRLFQVGPGPVALQVGEHRGVEAGRTFKEQDMISGTRRWEQLRTG